MNAPFLLEETHIQLFSPHPDVRDLNFNEMARFCDIAARFHDPNLHSSSPKLDDGIWQ